MRLSELARALRGQGTGAGDGTRGDLWLLLNTVLQYRIRLESRRTGPIGDEDIHDLASEKSLELMNQLDDGRWSPEDTSPERIVAFVSAVARNGLIDTLRRSGRRTTESESAADDPDVRIANRRAAEEPPDTGVERTEIVEALVGCAESMQPIHRTAWIFRVFLDMPSKAIAKHPEVDRAPNHVDVILQRCRERMSECMKKKGHEVSNMPTGSFAALWRAFRLDEFTARDVMHDG